MNTTRAFYFAQLTALTALATAREEAKKTEHVGLAMLDELYLKVQSADIDDPPSLDELLSYFMDTFLVNNQAKGGNTFISPKKRTEIRVRVFTSFLSHVNSNENDGQLLRIIMYFNETVTKPVKLVSTTDFEQTKNEIEEMRSRLDNLSKRIPA
jgi:hypothetical protein